MPRDYSNRWYLLIHLPSLTALQFNRLVNDYAVETNYTTCLYSVDPVDGISRYAVLKFDRLAFNGDKPQILKDRLIAIAQRLRIRQFKTSMLTTYAAYIPDENHDGHYTLRFSDRDFEFTR